MSFAKTILAIKNKEAGTAPVSLVEAIRQKTFNPAPFSKKRTRILLKNMLSALEADDLEEIRELFTDLYGQMVNVNPRAEHVFHPSSVEDDCPRRLFFDLAKTPKSDRVIRSFTFENLVTFDQGHWFHLWVQQKLKEAGMLKKAEQRVHDAEWKIDGRTDGDLHEPAGAVLEIKTMGSFQFKKLMVTRKPLEKHKKQAGLYAHFLKKEWVVFIYFNKDTSQFFEYHWKVEYDLIEPILKKMQSVIKAKKLPARHCSKDTCPRAMECPWRSHCFSLKE